jgi:hypothetical protein
MIDYDKGTMQRMEWAGRTEEIPISALQYVAFTLSLLTVYVCIVFQIWLSTTYGVSVCLSLYNNVAICVPSVPVHDTVD